MIPEALEKPTKADRRKSIYKLYVDLTQSVKQGFAETTEGEMEGLIAASLKLMNPPEDVEEITLPVKVLKQTALLAAQATARQLYERCKP